ncbi:sugar nucleotide-binding protein [Candidatus Curtissbacteria bacterium]|nr:sugar nucleotide-binding protein [Candidatus Curtissbacteria bacterium]
MSKLKLAIIGSKSMVGSRFCELATPNFKIIPVDLNGDLSVDITDRKEVSAFCKEYEFDWALLFAAFTDVDRAEEQRNDRNSSCWQINVEGTRNVAVACKKYRRNLLFMSTDFVFDGTGGPYLEDDPQGPDLRKVSWYGITKIEAEKLIKKTLPSYL